MTEFYKVSVRALAEFCLEEGDLVSTLRPSPSALEGQDTHQWAQANRPLGFQAEVSLSVDYQAAGVDLRLQGRADGLADGLIEEIKTSRVPPSELTATEKHQHRAQAELYGGLYALSFGWRETITIRVTYVHPQTLQQWSLDETLSAEDLVLHLVEQLELYSQWLQRLSQHRHDRDGRLKTLAFPYPSLRPSQRVMAEQVYKSCKLQRPVTIEAPTGTGKTLASLFPALRALPETRSHMLYFLSMKTTGQEAAWTALDQLDPTATLSAINLSAKSRLCLSSDTPCDGRACPYAENYYAKRNKIRPRLFDAQHWSVEALLRLGEQETICPYYLSQDWAIWADVVIGDVNYLYDTTAVQPYLLKEVDNRAIVLIDESHNLIERGRSMFTTRFEGASVQTLLHELPKALAKPFKAIQTALRAATKDCPNGLVQDEPKSLIPALQSWLSKSAQLLRDHPSYEPTLTWQQLIFDASRFIRLNELADAGDFRWRYQDGRPNERFVEVVCLNPARLLKQKHELVDTVIAFSATLKPFHYSNALNGLADSVSSEVPSPFGQHQFKVFIANDVSTRFRDRHLLPDKLNPLLKQLASSNQNALVFFPSFQVMRQVLGGLTEAEKDSFLIHESHWRESERERALATLRSLRGVCLLSVMGGVFSEGIDLPGEALEQVVIIGPGLPQVNETQKALADLMREQGWPAFDFTYTFPGLQKVLQAAGRCVRTETDIGSILLIDDRFSDYARQGWLPSNWAIKTGELTAWLASPQTPAS